MEEFYDYLVDLYGVRTYYYPIEGMFNVFGVGANMVIHNLQEMRQIHWWWNINNKRCNARQIYNEWIALNKQEYWFRGYYDAKDYCLIHTNEKELKKVALHRLESYYEELDDSFYDLNVDDQYKILLDKWKL